MKAYPYYFEFGEIPRKSPTQLFPNVQDDVLDLLYRMLDYNPKTRITAEQVGVWGLFLVGFTTSILYQ